MTLLATPSSPRFRLPAPFSKTPAVAEELMLLVEAFPTPMLRPVLERPIPKLTTRASPPAPPEVVLVLPTPVALPVLIVAEPRDQLLDVTVLAATTSSFAFKFPAPFSLKRAVC